MGSSSTSLQDPTPSPLAAWARTAVVAIWVIIATFFLGVIAIAISFFNKTGNPVHWIARVWGRSILAVSGIRVLVAGAERIDVNRPYIFMANHQSNLDIPVLLGHLPVQFRWLAKAELFKIPVFGQAMRGAGYISVDRANRQAAFESLQEAREKIRSGCSIVIFPEGTRSLDGSLKPFKKGGFVMAIGAGAPIVPLAVRGTYRIMPKNTWLIRPGDVAVDIGEPLATEGYTLESKEVLMEAVRNAISRGLASA
ncbi:MAG: lysophospholipid acyltransferase family protein [Hyphomicrobiales bacterium]